MVADSFELSYMEGLVTGHSGFFIPITEPDQSGSFPSDITSVSPRNLGKLLSQFTASLAFAIVILSQAENRASHSRHQVDTATEFWTFRLAPDNPRDVLKANLLAKVARRKQVQKWKEQNLLDNAQVTVLKAQVRGLEAYVSAISREITRRSDEAKNAGRIT